MTTNDVTIAVIGGGPSGLVTAKYLLEAGLEPVVFERSDDIGGQWNPANPSSGVWRGMRTNTNKTMTAFADHPAPTSFPMFPRAEQIQQYLHGYVERFGLRDRIITGASVVAVDRADDGWMVTWTDGAGQSHTDHHDAVVVASGRFTKPHLPEIPGLGALAAAGRVVHSAAFRTRDAFRGQRVLVYGNSISGLEIAAELAADYSISVISAARKARYILPKVARGVPGDWQWFTAFAALAGRLLPPEVAGPVLREQVLATAGNPASYGGLEPTDDIFSAGLSQSQHYLPLVAEGRIRVRPGVASFEGSVVSFTDGTTDEVDAVICATGYDIDLPYLGAGVRDVLTTDDDHVDLYRRTFHPDLPGLGFVGQYVLVGPYLPVLELQARWLAQVWSGAAKLPTDDDMWAAIDQFRKMKQIAPADLHHALAAELSSELGVAPILATRPDLARSLVFGPAVPARYVLDGPGARPDGEDLYRAAIGAFGDSAATGVSSEQVDAFEHFAQMLDDDDLIAATAAIRASTR